MDLDLRQIGSDFILTDDVQQDIELILMSMPGQWYQYPTLGVGLEKWSNSPEDRLKLNRKIREQLEFAGIFDAKIKIEYDNDKLKVYVD